MFAALEPLEGAPGRLERIGEKDGAPVFVDYAHKPDALEKALAALRPFVAGRLIVVFGCGGDRDAGKRPIMGEIATRAADVVIVTDDNPRSENPAAIRAAILAAAPGAREIGDRGEAIRAGVEAARSGRRAGHRRQRSRNRPDRRRSDAAVLRRRSRAGGARGGGMSRRCGREAELARALGGAERAARRAGRRRLDRHPHA